MTTRYINRPDADSANENRVHVRIPQQTSSSMFQGWGPKF